jgi:hypothetical protein
MKIFVYSVVATFLICMSVSNGYSEQKGDYDQKLEKILRKTSEDLNKQLPMTVDSETRLDSTLVYKNEIKYLYTLYTLHSSEIDAVLLRKTYEPNLINGVCTSENTSKLLKRGGKFLYIYRSKDGKEVLRMSVDKSKCDK